MIQILQFTFLKSSIQWAASILLTSNFQISSPPSTICFVGRIAVGSDLRALRENLACASELAIRWLPELQEFSCVPDRWLLSPPCKHKPLCVRAHSNSPVDDLEQELCQCPCEHPVCPETIWQRGGDWLSLSPVPLSPNTAPTVLLSLWLLGELWGPHVLLVTLFLVHTSCTGPAWEAPSPLP